MAASPRRISSAPGSPLDRSNNSPKNSLSMRIKYTLATITFTLLCFEIANSARAQQVPIQQFNDQQQRRQMEMPLKGITTSTNAPELYPGENDDVGPQAILKLRERHTHFEVFADSQYLYTDNNRLTDINEISTAYTINTVQMALAPSAYPMGPGLLAPKVGVRSQWYNYDIGPNHSEDTLDFNAQTAFVGLQYRYNQKWVFDTQLEYTRLLDQGNYKEFYTEFAPSLSVQRYFPITDRLLLAASWQGIYHITSVDPLPRRDVNNRLDNTLGLTLSYQAIGNLVVQPFYRFQHTYYNRTSLNTSRNDYFNIVGAAVSYIFTQQLSARVFVTETFRDSDDNKIPGYQKLDAGIGASFLFRF
jgi:hypothetical protein